jgi:hypothetical protein
MLQNKNRWGDDAGVKHAAIQQSNYDDCPVRRMRVLPMSPDRVKKALA